MRTGDREPIPTVAEAVREAAAICDPNGADAAVRGLIDSFEDDDRPVTAVDDCGEGRPRVERGTAPDQDPPAAKMPAAAPFGLPTNPDQDPPPGEHVLGESARLYF